MKNLKNYFSAIICLFVLVGTTQVYAQDFEVDKVPNLLGAFDDLKDEMRDVETENDDVRDVQDLVKEVNDIDVWDYAEDVTLKDLEKIQMYSRKIQVLAEEIIDVQEDVNDINDELLKGDRGEESDNDRKDPVSRTEGTKMGTAAGSREGDKEDNMDTKEREEKQEEVKKLQDKQKDIKTQIADVYEDLQEILKG